MRYLQIILLVTFFLFGCRRECKDKDADNYGLIGKYGEDCDYSHLDDWYKILMIDSVSINGSPFIFNKKEVSFTGSGYNTEKTGGFGKETNYYTNQGSNNCFYRFYPDKNLSGILNSLDFSFGVPEAKDHTTTFDTVATVNFIISDHKGIHSSYKYYSKEVPVELYNTKVIRGTKYHFFHAHASSLDSDTAITAEELQSFSMYFNINYEVYNVITTIGAYNCYPDGSGKDECSE